MGPSCSTCRPSGLSDCCCCWWRRRCCRGGRRYNNLKLGLQFYIGITRLIRGTIPRSLNDLFKGIHCKIHCYIYSDPPWFGDEEDAEESGAEVVVVDVVKEVDSTTAAAWLSWDRPCEADSLDGGGGGDAAEEATNGGGEDEVGAVDDDILASRLKSEKVTSSLVGLGHFKLQWLSNIFLNLLLNATQHSQMEATAW